MQLFFKLLTLLLPFHDVEKISNLVELVVIFIVHKRDYISFWTGRNQGNCRELTEAAARTENFQVRVFRAPHKVGNFGRFMFSFK